MIKKKVWEPEHLRQLGESLFYSNVWDPKYMRKLKGDSKKNRNFLLLISHFDNN